MGVFPTLWTRGKPVSLMKKQQSDARIRAFLCFPGEESDCLKRLNGPGYPFINKDSQKGIAQPERLCLPHGSREKYGQKNDNTGFFGDVATVLPPSVHVGNHMRAFSGPKKTSLLFYRTEDPKDGKSDA